MNQIKRPVGYAWNLRKVMAGHGMFNTSDLVPLLRERGIDLSASQVHRLVTGTPERLSLPVLAALCDIFDTDAAELISTEAVSATVARTGTDDAPDAARPLAAVRQLRPAPARIAGPR